MSESKGLPKGWAEVSLADVGTLYCGQSPQTAEVNQVGRGTPYFTGPEQWDGHQLLVTKWTTNPRRVVPDGWIFITVKGAGVGTLFPGMAGAIGRDVYAYEPSRSLSAKFIEHSLRHNIDQVLQHAKGDIPGLSKNHILNHNTAFPPRNEQDRIVAEIETQFTRLDAAVVALRRVQANLKRYRASVLQAACTGRLVPTEAEFARAEGRAYESAEQLLQRILQERRVKWESEQLDAMKAEGKVPKDDMWKSKYREPVKPDTSELSELPEGWVWATVEQLAQLVTDGDHNPPKRVPTGVPHLTAKHIKRWHITFDNCTYITLDDFERTRFRFEPLAGDLIITCVGTVGETAIVPAGIVFSADRNLAGIRLVSNGIDNKMLQYVLSAPEWQIRIRQASGSTAQPHLYLGDLRALPAPIPPIIEQQRIIAEVERRLSVIDELEAVIVTNLKRADRLRQAILKRAFEGKLVPQDPTDEPASVLLERIRMERERRTEKPKETPQQTNSHKPIVQPTAATPVQGELALGFRA